MQRRINNKTKDRAAHARHEAGLVLLARMAGDERAVADVVNTADDPVGAWTATAMFAEWLLRDVEQPEAIIHAFMSDEHSAVPVYRSSSLSGRAKDFLSEFLSDGERHPYWCVQIGWRAQNMGLGLDDEKVAKALKNAAYQLKVEYGGGAKHTKQFWWRLPSARKATVKR